MGLPASLREPRTGGFSPSYFGREGGRGEAGRAGRVWGRLQPGRRAASRGETQPLRGGKENHTLALDMILFYFLLYCFKTSVKLPGLLAVRSVQPGQKSSHLQAGTCAEEAAGTRWSHGGTQGLRSAFFRSRGCSFQTSKPAAFVRLFGALVERAVPFSCSQFSCQGAFCSRRSPP